MARKWFDAQIAQYAHRRTEGNGLATWEGDVTCHLPSLTLYGESRVTDGLLVGNNATVAVSGRNLLPPFSEILTNLTPYDGGYSQYVFRVPPHTKVTICSPHEHDTGLGFYLYALPKSSDKYGSNWMYHPMEDAYQNDAITTTAGADGVIRLVGYGWTTADARGLLENNLWAVLGESPLPYEPYVDGGTVSAPYLHGIPGTPYRDEWDAVTGRGVRRCAVLYNYGGEAITTPYLCTSGGLEEGADVVYGIPDTPFTYLPAATLIQPNGAVTVRQTGGDIPTAALVATGVCHTS